MHENQFNHPSALIYNKFQKHPVTMNRNVEHDRARRLARFPVDRYGSNWPVTGLNFFLLATTSNSGRTMPCRDGEAWKFIACSSTSTKQLRNELFKCFL